MGRDLEGHIIARDEREVTVVELAVDAGHSAVEFGRVMMSAKSGYD